MIKTQYIVGAVALITGTALGFMDIFLFDGKAESSVGEVKSTAFSQTAPRFMGGQTKKALSQITPSLSNMSVLIPHYAEMSAAELKDEIKRLRALSPQGKSAGDPVNFAIRYLVLRLGRDFPGDISSYIENETDDIGKHYAGALLSEWAKNDFDGAMGYLMENLAKLNFSTSIFVSLVRKLTVNDPEKAMEWGLSQKGKIRQKALAEVFDVLVDNQREKIADFAGKLLPEDWKKDRQLLSDISEKWGRSDWESGMRWAETLPDKQKKEAIVGILEGLSQVHLEKATVELKKQPQDIQEDITKVIVDKLEYTNDDPTDENSGRMKALGWIMENAPAGENTNKLIRGLFASSTALTPELIDRVKKMPDGSIRDNALRGMASVTTAMVKYGQFSYDEAFALTDRIKDPQTKKESLMSNVRSWVTDDPESARVWIEEKSGFTREEKERQLKFCEESLKFLKENPREKGVFSKGMTISTYEG